MSWYPTRSQEKGGRSRRAAERIIRVIMWTTYYKLSSVLGRLRGRLCLAFRLLVAVFSLPSAALPAAGSLTTADTSTLLFEALLRPQRRRWLRADRHAVGGASGGSSAVIARDRVNLRSASASCTRRGSGGVC